MKKSWILILVIALFCTGMLSACSEDTPENSENVEATTSSDENHKHILPLDKYDNSDEETHTWVCECGETVTEPHRFVMESNAGYHWTGCACSYSKDQEEHTIIDGKCSVCGWQEDSSHEHQYRMEYRSEEEHMLICDCGKQTLEKHVFTYEIGASGHTPVCKCEYRGKTQSHVQNENRTCSICGASRHVHEISGGYTKTDAESHWWKCNCGETMEESHITMPEYFFDSSTHFKKCYCGVALNIENHTYKNGKCSVCNCTQNDSKGFEFEETDGGYTLTMIGTCKDIEIKIPATHNGKPVVAIEAGAFEGNSDILTVIVPNSVKTIGASAFAGCTSLEQVTLPDGLTEIAENLFSACTSLEKVNLPKGVTDIGMFAFSGCTAFKGFEKLEQITFFGDFAFANCSSFSGEIRISGRDENDHTVEVGNGAFNGCTAITSILIDPRSLTLGGGAFQECTGLKTVIFEGLWMEDGFDVGTFSDCTSLESITLVGDEEAWMQFLADSVVDEEMGLSWYKGSGNFKVLFEDPVAEKIKPYTINELYKIIEQTYWQ